MIPSKPGLSIACLLLIIGASSGVVHADEPLQGKVEQDAPRPKMYLDRREMLDGSSGGNLNGSATDTTLNGGAQSNMMNQMQPGVPMYGQPQPQGPLQGGAMQNPTMLSGTAGQDADEGELQIDWDRWRNNLMHSIQNNTIARINVHNEINFVFDPRRQMMVSRYPLGISATYACEVLANRKITNIRIIQSSGWPNFDQSVMQAINDLQGNSGLKFPKGSKRQVVYQQASVGTSATNQYQNFQFGDMERQRFSN